MIPFVPLLIGAVTGWILCDSYNEDKKKREQEAMMQPPIPAEVAPIETVTKAEEPEKKEEKKEEEKDETKKAE